MMGTTSRRILLTAALLVVPAACATSEVLPVVATEMAPLAVAAQGPIAGGAPVHSRQQIRFEGSTAVFERDDGPAHHPSRVLVQFKRGARQQLLPGSRVARVFAAHPRLVAVEAPRGLHPKAALRHYAACADVEYAELDHVIRVNATPNDPRFAEQWDMAKIAAPAAWDSQTDASDVVVAVIDTGIDFAHPDLTSNLWNDPITGAHGFTCVGGTCVPDGQDDNGHGTHVAGTIGGAANNDVGISGVSWRVQLLPAADAVGGPGR